MTALRLRDSAGSGLRSGAVLRGLATAATGRAVEIVLDVSISERVMPIQVGSRAMVISTASLGLTPSAMEGVVRTEEE